MNMVIRVKLFARAKDLAGTEELRVELPAGATVADLRRQLAQIAPALAVGLLARSAIAADEEFADDGKVLRPAMTIALIPPVSGG
jgi:molybdopterin converting factor subunit 1